MLHVEAHLGVEGQLPPSAGAAAAALVAAAAARRVQRPVDPVDDAADQRDDDEDGDLVHGRVRDGLHVLQGLERGRVVGLQLQHVAEVEGGLLVVAVRLQDLAQLEVLQPGVLVGRLHLEGGEGGRLVRLCRFDNPARLAALEMASKSVGLRAPWKAHIDDKLIFSHGLRNRT